MTTHALTRRKFLEGGAIGAAAIAAGSLLGGCSGPKKKADGQGGADNANSSQSSWKTAPQPVADSEIKNNYSCDVVVVGSGYAGVTAYRELAEEGFKPILVEKQPEDTYKAMGNEFAALNAKVLQDRGMEHIDPVDFFQNWMKMHANQCNQELVMKFAQNSEANSNWYLDKCTSDDIAAMTTSFYPPTAHQMSELSGIKFWPSVCSFYDEKCNETKLQRYNRDAGTAAGGEVHWGEEAYYLTKDGDSISGLVSKDSDGNYAKYSCKAVILATGGFGGNQEMMQDLMSDVYGELVGDEQLTSMSTNDGAGVKMAYWAGAHLETTPVPGMNFRGLSVPGKMNCLPQAVWVDSNGKRYCNEYYPTAEQRGLETVLRARTAKWAVCDSNFPEYRQYSLPQHAGFYATDENIQKLRDSLDKAYAKFKGAYTGSDDDQKPQQGPVVTVDYIADDTLEGLADQMGFSGETKENFLSQMNHWNQICDNGSDDQFGRDSRVLFHVNQAPYFATSFTPQLGETMVTCGGIITDGDQNALDKDYQPIPGLYVSGNDCGGRFGTEYTTPIPGCSLGMAITLGRECGKSVGQFLGK